MILAGVQRHIFAISPISKYRRLSITHQIFQFTETCLPVDIKCRSQENVTRFFCTLRYGSTRPSTAGPMELLPTACLLSPHANYCRCGERRGCARGASEIGRSNARRGHNRKERSHRRCNGERRGRKKGDRCSVPRIDQCSVRLKPASLARACRQNGPVIATGEHESRAGDSGVRSRLCPGNGASGPCLGQRPMVLLPASPAASGYQYRHPNRHRDCVHHQNRDSHSDADRHGNTMYDPIGRVVHCHRRS
jgi:hypothetical protein